MTGQAGAPACAREDGAAQEAASRDDAAERDGREGRDCRAQRVVERLLLAYGDWYDVERDAEVCGRRFAGMAAFHQRGERYVLSRRARLWGVSNHEYVLFDAPSSLDAPMLDGYLDFMRTRAIGLVHPEEPDHMSTDLGLILVAGRADQEALRLVRTTRWRKSYRLGLQGWTDLRVAVVDLSREGRAEVVTNGAGKRMRPAIEAALAGAKGSGQVAGGPGTAAGSVVGGHEGAAGRRDAQAKDREAVTR